MWAPARTLAVTAAAVAQSRSSGERSPVAAVRNDLRDGPTSIGRSSSASRSNLGQGFPGVLGALGETKSRVEDQPIARDPAARRPADCRLELSPDLAGDVAVHGPAIHLGGASAVVHQHERSAGARDDRRKVGVVLQATDVVDDRCARGHGVSRDRGLVGVDRHRHATVTRQRFDDRQHASQFLAGVDGLGAGPRRLAANVQNVGAVGNHLQAIGDRRAGSNRRPPSANESGVTLMIPMMSVRPPRSSGARPGKAIE